MFEKLLKKLTYKVRVWLGLDRQYFYFQVKNLPIVGKAYRRFSDQDPLGQRIYVVKVKMINGGRGSDTVSYEEIDLNTFNQK